MKKDKFLILRRELVERYIKGRIQDEKVIDAFLKVPRDFFVPEEYKIHAYEDRPLPIGRGQTISQPYIVALMTELLELKGSERILEIGGGSGYQAAILAEILKEGEVYSIEYDGVLAEELQKRMRKLGIDNVYIKDGDGYYGWEEYSPYERIIITCATPHIPEPLIQQLKIGGIVVAPVGRSVFGQDLIKAIKKEDGKLFYENYGGCVFVPMRGRVEE